MSNVIVRDLNYCNGDALENMVAYGLGIEKDELDLHIPCVKWNGFGVLLSSPKYAIESLKVIKRIFEKDGGNLLHHVIITIKCKQSIPHIHQTAREIGNSLGLEMCNAGFQNLYFIHMKDGYAHIHFVINSINFITGNRINSTGWLGNQMLKFLKLYFGEYQWNNQVFYNHERYFY